MDTRVWIALLGFVFADSIGNIFISAGMKQMGEFHPFPLKTLPRRLLHVFNNFQISCGIFSTVVGFFLFISLLSWANLSLVYPSTSLTYVVSLFGARFILHENISRARLLGTILVGVGVALVSIG
ncbi:EamA family transporter [Cyanobacteria bacterium FACHB-DQ100]|uniref:EamA family transporter n=1 Tax=unclassified Leptolyngbya TaxID=2650499 RepID=UPI00168107D1|nr:EamA family transporter [Leptolyngbya sp. FACHB-17]MBD1824455.1 EamA family transporter [Cyanobacteria bacterium FACHB-DQ100]MBD2081009.1 EamA family transporter [Leptolyngbya sp. FACHB-17]